MGNSQIFIIEQYMKNKMHSDNLFFGALGLIPGFKDFLLKQYLSGFARLTLYCIGIVISFSLWGIELALFISVIMAASSYYCQLSDAYIEYQKGLLKSSNCKNKIEIAQNILQHSDVRKVIVRVQYSLIIPIALFVYFLFVETGFTLRGIMNGLPVAVELIEGILTPNWMLLPEAVLIYGKQTIEIALLGSILAFLFSIPISILCSWNLMSMHPITKFLYYPARAVMVTLRSIPTFLLGLVFVALVGLGPFPGVLAIFVFSMGIMVKLFSEAIENIDYAPIEAVSACGGSPVNIIMFAVIPQVIPVIIAQTLYCIEINVHSATVLGLVGAEGIGLPIHEYLSALAYSDASVYILVTVLMTIVIDYTSAYLRNKVIAN